MSPFAVLAFAGAIFSHPVPAAQNGWKLIWSDDFHYAGLPNPKKWGYEFGKVRNGEAQFYTKDRPANARVENGELVIEGRHEKYQGSEYTSASLVTHNKFSFEFGRVEVVAKLPKGRGTWPAIWMMGEDVDQVGWPRCGEIDIMEHVLQTPNTIYGTVHQMGPDGNHVSKGGKVDVPDYGDAFHTYALEWSKNGLDFFVDSNKYFSYPWEAGHWTFDRPMYLLINLAIGGAWGGQNGIDAAAFPQKFEIKSVKVFQRD